MANLFEIRDASLPRPCVREGHFVKVGARGERFWCRVRGVETDGKLCVVVDNDLLRSQWRRGHELALQGEHVLESADGRDRSRFQHLAAELGSSREAALVWRDLRVTEGVAARPTGPAWLVVPK
jgi:hypothetical protein